jgi:hypothetical protein
LKNSLLPGIHIVNIAYPIEDHLVALSNRGKDYKMYLKETVLLFCKHLQASEVLELLPI